MSDNEHVNFLGLKVIGNINRGDRARQRTREEFEELVRPVLFDDSIIGFGWHQYTPYYIDGDACEFGVRCFWVRTTLEPFNDDDESWDDDYDVEWDSHPSLGNRERWYNQDTQSYEYKPYVGSNEARFDRVCALGAAIDRGEFNDVLLGLFGEHARVTVARSGIVVAHFDHS